MSPHFMVRGWSVLKVQRYPEVGSKCGIQDIVTYYKPQRQRPSGLSSDGGGPGSSACDRPPGPC